MKNDFEVRGDVTAIIINSPKYGRLEALISTNKLECAKEFLNSWRVIWNRNTKSFYVAGSTPMINGKQSRAFLHRWITNAPKGLEVDHINHDTLKNTDDNLRICTHAENLQNQKGAQKHSKSGIRGVYWNKVANKWHADIRLNGKTKYLGLFEDIREAERVVKEARKKYMPYSREA